MGVVVFVLLDFLGTLAGVSSSLGCFLLCCWSTAQVSLFLFCVLRHFLRYFVFFRLNFVEARFDPLAKLAAWCPSVSGVPFQRHCTPQSLLGIGRYV